MAGSAVAGHLPHRPAVSPALGDAHRCLGRGPAGRQLLHCQQRPDGHGLHPRLLDAGQPGAGDDMLAAVAGHAHLRHGAAQVEAGCRLPGRVPLVSRRLPVLGRVQPHAAGGDQQENHPADAVPDEQLLPQPHAGARFGERRRARQRPGDARGGARRHQLLLLALQPVGVGGARVVGLQPPGVSRGAVPRQRASRGGQGAWGEGSAHARSAIRAGEGRHHADDPYYAADWRGLGRGSNTGADPERVFDL
ncbi:Zn(II)2Cys6 transcription factor, partial [Tolypocladium paradoxum]